MKSLAGFPAREAQAMGLIGFAHMLSHLYMLAFAPLAASIISDMQISAIEYGAALTAFAVVTGIFQTPMGLLVERIGGRPVLVFGLFVNSAAFCLIAWVSNDYLTFILFMALAGVGNSVFHPADYSLISATVDEKRIGKAFSVHTFVGHVGFIVGPILAAGLEPFIGWRGSIATIGIVGVSMSIVLILFGSVISDGNTIKKSGPIGESLRELFSSRPVALFFLFYMLSSMANFGMVQFSVLAFQPLYGIEHVIAVAALTAYQIGTMALVIPGGILADRTTRYDFIMLVGFGISAIAIVFAGTGWFPFWIVTILICIAGGMRGGVNASRDVAVRQIAGRIPVGTVFAFVSTGFLVGQALSGFIYGYLFQHYPPNYIFFASAIFSVLGMATVVFNQGTRRLSQAAGE
jgi:FSR family fosmidomycin resistance protein-like MFS transporter